MSDSVDPEPSRPEPPPTRITTQWIAFLHGLSKRTIGIGITAAAAVALAAVLLLHPGRAQEANPAGSEKSINPTGVSGKSAGPSALRLKTGNTSPISGGPLTLTPINPALIGFHPTPEQFAQGSDSPSRVALTFDAGSDAKAVPLILKELQERHVRATFFLTGKFCEKFPDECRAIADAGMELGNHSYRHPHFTRLSEAQIVQELERAEAAIVKVCGRGAKPLFRFPYGDYDERTQQIVAAAGYQPIRWTLDSLDAFRKPKTEDFVVERINSRVKPGYITLMHVSCVTSADALPRIFAHLDEIGAQAAPVSELLLSAPPSSKLDAAIPNERIDH